MQVAVSDAAHPELMAAIRGAGTVFGIVTELTFRLFDGIDSVYAGNLMLPDDAQHSTFRFIPLHFSGSRPLYKHALQTV